MLMCSQGNMKDSVSVKDSQTSFNLTAASCGAKRMTDSAIISLQNNSCIFIAQLSKSTVANYNNMCIHVAKIDSLVALKLTPQGLEIKMRC